MRIDSLRRYAERIDRVVALLEARLKDGEAPNLDELAEAAAMSKFHFHRIFRLLTGETVSVMVRRLRLARGGGALADGSVTDASGDAAYASSQAFARAMRAVTGLSATEAKRMEARDALFAAPSASAPLAIEMVSRDPFRVIVIRNIGDYAELNATYVHLFEIAGRPEQVTGIWGIQHSDPRFDMPGECRFDAAISLVRTPPRLQEAHEDVWGGGAFLKLRHNGSFDAVPEALDALMLESISREEVALRDAPTLIHYLDDPEEVTEEELRSDLYLPIEG